MTEKKQQRAFTICGGRLLPPIVFDFTIAVDELLTTLFFAIATLVTRRPKTTMALMTFIMLAFGSGIIVSGRSESSVSKLWIPQDSEAIYDQKRSAELWPQTLRFNFVYVASRRKLDGEGLPTVDISTHEHVAEFVDLYEQIMAIEVEHPDRPGIKLSFADLCFTQSDNGKWNADVCSYLAGVLDAWRYDDYDEEGNDLGIAKEHWYEIDHAKLDRDGAIGDAAIKARLSAGFKSAFGSEVYLPVYMGGYEYNAGLLQSAEVFRFWFVFPWNDPSLPQEPAEITEDALYSLWEAELAKVCDKWNADNSHDLQVYFLLSDGFDVALSKALNSDVLLFLLGYLLMVIYCTSALGKYDCVHSKRALGIVGVSSVVLSVIGGIGFSCYLGVPITAVTQVVPFLAMGIGVDDMFVLVNSFDHQDPKESIEDRVIMAVSNSGVAITITTVTDFAAFMTGVNSQLPAIVYYCVNLAVVIFFDYCMQVTFFVAFMTIDAHREERGHYDCCACMMLCDKDNAKVADENLVDAGSSKLKSVVGSSSHKGNINGEPEKLGLVERFFQNGMGPLLRKWWYRWTVIAVFSTLLVVGIYYAQKIQAKFEIYDVLRDDSPIIPFFVLLYAKFQQLGIDVKMVIDDRDFDYVANRKVIDEALTELQNCDSVKPGFLSWLDRYNEFLLCSPCCLSDADKLLPGPLGSLPTWNGSPECNPGYLDKVVNNYFKDKEAFNSLLHPYLNDKFYGPSADQFVFVAEGCSVTMTKEEWDVGLDGKPCSLQASNIIIYHNGELQTASTDDRSAAMKEVRKALKATELYRVVSESTDVSSKLFLDCGDYMFWEQYGLLKPMAIQNLWQAILCVMGIALIFLIHPGMSLLLGIAIIGIDFEILAGMYLSNTYINVVSVANLILALGLAVDYCFHLCHTYITMFIADPEEDSIERTVKALVHIGPSVLDGGFCTFLGVLALGFSQSSMFRMFFTMFVLNIGFGMLYGLVLLPCLLCYCGFVVPKLVGHDTAMKRWLANREAQAGTKRIITENEKTAP